MYKTSSIFFSSHYFSILIHTYEGSGKNANPVSYFYALIPVGPKASGERILKAVNQMLEKDGLGDWLKNHLISTVSDGAGRPEHF